MSTFETSRSTNIAAGTADVHARINDFHEWTAWSPWEDIDPNLQRIYTGPDQGVGAHYAWQGNRKAGEGSMEIVSSTPEQIGIKLTFLKPWRATNDVVFTLTPSGSGTDVTWRMSGEHQGVGKVFARLFSMDKLIGKDFERGLSRLKAVLETAS